MVFDALVDAMHGVDDSDLPAFRSALAALGAPPMNDRYEFDE